MPNSPIYVDHAATTPLDPQVRDAMVAYLQGDDGNPSSIYRSGREARRALDEARDTLARLLGARSPREIIFTSGGSESDNLALKGVAWAAEGERRHIVTTAIEHHAVLESADFLESQGFEVTCVAPDERGMIHPERVRDALRDDTFLLSVMHANNETGVIQPVAEIAHVAKERGAYFHIDAVQTVGHIPVDVEGLGCDLLSLSAHKFYGPKGVGALWVRRGVPLAPLIHGGGQEQERRAGTENVAAVVGLAKALSLAYDTMDVHRASIERLRDRLEKGLVGAIGDIRINGEGVPRLPGHVNVTIDGAPGESVLLNLDMRGIEASSGSACTSGSLEASHVLLAMGRSRQEALSSLRFSLGKGNTEDEVDRVVETLADVVERIRSRSHDLKG